MNKTTLNSQKEKHSMLSLRRATTSPAPPLPVPAHFYPRSPCGERPTGELYLSKLEKFLSTLSLRRATHAAGQADVRGVISIHALLAESDFSITKRTNCLQYFYPRSPCGERPAGDVLCHILAVISIHALLAESDWPVASYATGQIISIHALLAESDFQHWQRRKLLKRISIHALLAESDAPQTSQAGNQSPFLSTLSLRRATVYALP